MTRPTPSVSVRVFLAGLCMMLVAWFGPRVLGPTAQPQFAAVMAEVNQSGALGEGVRVTGISIEGSRAVVSLERRQQWQGQVVLVDPDERGVTLRSRWFGFAAGAGTPPPDDVLRRLGELLDRSFADDPYRDPEDDRSRPAVLNRATVAERLPYNRDVFGKGRLIVLGAMVLLAMAATIWRNSARPRGPQSSGTSQDPEKRRERSTEGP